MKITEMIEKLEAIKKEAGDLEVVILTDTPDGMFHAEFEPFVEHIGLPNVDETGEEEVCAIAWPHCFDEEPVEVKKSHLTVVKN